MKFSSSMLLVAGLSLNACGSMLDFTEGEETDSQGATVTPPEGSELIDIPISLQEDTSGFNLLGAATAYSINVDSCVSGHTDTVTDAVGSLKAYEFDQNCLAKLITFTANGVNYQVQSDFTDWLANDTAVFEQVGTPANTINVKVLAQLPSPITGTEVVTYQFSEISLGTDELIAEATVSDSHTITVNGQGAPNFTISAVTYDSMTAAGEGQFSFELTCANAQTGTAATTACDDATLINMDYVLVEDTTAGTLTVAQAGGLFVGSEIAVVQGDFHATVNGGFTTGSLTGPATMVSKPNMMLVLRAGGVSFTYYNVDVTLIP